MKTNDERTRLARRASALKQWMLATLEIRELRDRKSIEAAKGACAKVFLDEVSTTGSRQLLVHFWQDVEYELVDWISNPAKLPRAFSTISAPRWESREIALAFGLILLEEAAKCFASRSHAKNLFAASLLADAIETRDFWIAISATGYRNPEKHFVAAEQAIRKSEMRSWLRSRQQELGRVGAENFHNRPGGSRDKRNRIRELWASGKYSSRDGTRGRKPAGGRPVERRVRPRFAD